MQAQILAARKVTNTGKQTNPNLTRVQQMVANLQPSKVQTYKV